MHMGGEGMAVINTITDLDWFIWKYTKSQYLIYTCRALPIFFSFCTKYFSHILRDPSNIQKSLLCDIVSHCLKSVFKILWNPYISSTKISLDFSSQQRPLSTFLEEVLYSHPLMYKKERLVLALRNLQVRIWKEGETKDTCKSKGGRIQMAMNWGKCYSPRLLCITAVMFCTI